MSTLDFLSRELLTIGQHIVEQEGELDFFLEQELERVTHDLEIKVDSYAYRLEKLCAMAAFWADKAYEAQQIQNKIEAHIDNLKTRIQHTMGLLEKRELLGEKNKFSLKKNPPKVLIENEEILPSEYKVQTVSYRTDKKLISERIKSGVEVPGAKLIQGESVVLGLNKGM